jgi:Protein of unknown function (DUF3313)
MHPMKFMVGLVCATMTLGLAQPLPAASPENWDGLVQVKSSKMDVAFLSPGADFRAFKKVMLDKPEVAFQKNWMRDMNSSRFDKVDKDDAKKILATVQSNTTDIFTEVFNKAGYEVVTEPGDDVLRVRSGVIDLYVNAPDTMSAGRTRSFTANAGEATLVLELRDSLTNALLGRVLDRRETRGMPGISNSVTNLSDYRMLAKQWAGISVKGLEQLKAHSPIPNPLKPGQKLN